MSYPDVSEETRVTLREECLGAAERIVASSSPKPARGSIAVRVVGLLLATGDFPRCGKRQIVQA
jgi:hypothetical protein